MPFGGFDSFRDCVNKNGDKDSPEAFCSWLEHEVTSKWPGEMTQGLPANVVEKFWQAFDISMNTKKNEVEAIEFASKAAESFGWLRKKQGWARKAENKVSTRAVYGVPIFAVGVHNGDKYTASDLKGMVASFYELTGRFDPPVKIGHTSDEFNIGLAEKMGIPPELIKGEAGNGIMAFGWVSGLRVSGNIMYADLVDVPEPVANLIDNKSYKPVSAEILFDYKDKGKTYPMVLAGLALLGADIPAVKESGLETAAVYQVTEKGSKAIEYEEVTMKPEEAFRAFRSKFAELEALVKQVFSGKEHLDDKSKDKEEETMNIEILKALGLAATAKDEEVLAAVKKLAEMPGAAPGGAGGGLGLIAAKLGLPDTATIEEIMAAIEKLTAGEAAPAPELMKQYTDRVTKLESDNKTLKRAARVIAYTAIAGDLHAISGKPDELAADLLALEEAAGEEAAKKVVAKYQDLNKRMVDAGIFKAKGTPAEGDTSDEHEFTKELKVYMAEKQVDEATAQDALRKSKPALFKDFMANRPRMVVRAEDRAEQ